MRSESEPPASRPKSAVLMGVLSALGILLSITNEWVNLPWETPGWALLARSLHIWLGVGALIGVLFRFRPGLWMLFIWILSGFPVIATDPSGTWTDPILEANLTTESWTRTNEGSTHEYYNAYTQKGINFAPLAVLVWFIVAMRLQAFPGIHLPLDQRYRMRAGASVFLGAWLLGIVAYTCHLITAPFLIWGSAKGQAFYYKHERMGTQFLRIDEALLKRIGLDATQPIDNWDLVETYHAPFGLGVHISDGIASARIDVHNLTHDWREISIQTPWGERTGSLIRKDSPANRPINQLRPTIYMVHPLIGKDFRSQIAPESATVAPGAPLKLMMTIEPIRDRPQFAEANVRICFVGLEPNNPDRKKYRIFKERFDTPEGLSALSEGAVQIPLTVEAPRLPGTYSVYLQSIWLYDADGEYAEPIRKIGRSSYALIKVQEAE